MASSVEGDASDGGAVVSRSLAEGTTVPGLIVPDPADKLVRRVDGVGERRNARDDQKMPGDRKNRYKTWRAGMVNPLRASSSPQLFCPPAATPRAPCRPVAAPRTNQTRRKPSSSPVVGCLRLRISNSTVWKCGSDLKGRGNSASFPPLKIATYVYSRSSILMARRIVSTEPVGVDPPVLYIAGER